MSSTLQASVFMGKHYSENFHSIKNTGKDLTTKHMFDIFEKVIAEQDEIYGLCEGCLVVRSGHGPQAEVAQGVGPGPLVEL